MKTIINRFCFLLCCLLVSSCGDLTGEVDKFPSQRTYSEIYSINVDGTGLIKLTSDKSSITFMQYLPKSDKILFVQDSKTYIMNSDGSQRRLLITKSIIAAPNFYTRYFVITNDEQNAYYVKTELGYPQSYSILYSISLSTGEEKQLLQDSSWINELGVSEDGLHLVYNSTSYSPYRSALFFFNTASLEKRKIKEGINLYCFYPQFIRNSDQVLFFERIDTTSNNTYLKVINLIDTSKSKIIDTVTAFLSVYPSLNSNGNIFYIKSGITVLNINSNQIKTIPFGLYSYSIDDNINWSYNGTTLIFTDNLYNQIIMYNLIDDSALHIEPNQGGREGTTIPPFEYPYLNSNNSKIFYVAHFTETIYI